MTWQELAKLPFDDVTVEQFKEFFKGEGWTSAGEDEVDRESLCGLTFSLNSSGCLCLGGWVLRDDWDNLYDALEAANEVAETYALGGWRP